MAKKLRKLLFMYLTFHKKYKMEEIYPNKQKKKQPKVCRI